MTVHCVDRPVQQFSAASLRYRHLRNACYAVSLRQVLPQASFVGCADICIKEICHQSKNCKPGVLFAALPGTQVHGASFIQEAILQGAMSVLVEQPLVDVSIPQCVVPNTRAAYGKIAAAIHGYPSRRLQIAAVTGTNGKTTVSWLIRSIIEAAGQPAGLLGTIEYSDSQTSVPSTLTTPDAHSLSDWLHQTAEQGAQYAAIEVSSHALHQERLAGTKVDVAVVTNVTQDHFDYHNTYEAYHASKTKILKHLKRNGSVVLNLDDSGCRMMQEHLSSATECITFAIDQPADVTANIEHISLAGTSFVLTIDGREIEVVTTLPGLHNVSNCLAAAAAAKRLGFSLDEIARGIELLTTVPGRMERIDCGQPFHLFVDYAHTDDALQRCLSFLKNGTHGRLIVVFGAGGDRDTSKRSLLGRAACLADVAVITNDNPRTEDPQEILNQIQQGMQNSTTEQIIEPNRSDAIRRAVKIAQPGDTVLIAGKGHETEQILNTEVLPFDDRVIAREHLLTAIPCYSEKIPA